MNLASLSPQISWLQNTVLESRQKYIQAVRWPKVSFPPCFLNQAKAMQEQTFSTSPFLKNFTTFKLLPRGIRGHQTMFNTGQFDTGPDGIDRSWDSSLDHYISLPGWDVCSKLCLPLCSFCLQQPFSWEGHQRQAFWQPPTFGLWNTAKPQPKPCRWSQGNGSFRHSLH